jgi:hypothetical protein
MALYRAIDHLREIIHGAESGITAMIIAAEQCIAAKGDGNAWIIVGCIAGNKDEGDYHAQQQYEVLLHAP